MFVKSFKELKQSMKQRQLNKLTEFIATAKTFILKHFRCWTGFDFFCPFLPISQPQSTYAGILGYDLNYSDDEKIFCPYMKKEIGVKVVCEFIKMMYPEEVMMKLKQYWRRHRTCHL